MGGGGESILVYEICDYPEQEGLLSLEISVGIFFHMDFAHAVSGVNSFSKLTQVMYGSLYY